MKNAVITAGILAGVWLMPVTRAAGQQADSPVDLLERYPTTLTEGSKGPDEARDWEFSPEDVYRLTGFKIQFRTSLRIDAGQATVGFGHCPDGVLWAAVVPLGVALVEGSANPEAQEEVELIWLRFHPAAISEVFPPETVRLDGDRTLAPRLRRIAEAKLSGSWHFEGRAVIPEPDELIIDLDTTDGSRRLFLTDPIARKAAYQPEFAAMPMERFDAPLDPDVARAAFTQLQKTFEDAYPGFGLRKDLDWDALCSQYRGQLADCKTKRRFAELSAEMLANLQDLNVAVAFEGTQLAVFDPPRPRKANPFAQQHVVGAATPLGTNVVWSRTKDNVGFIEITGWNDPNLVNHFDAALQGLRGTVGLIIDVRLNHGGDEALARKVAGKFAKEKHVYAYHQVRNGPGRTDLGKRTRRAFQPRGAWPYEAPVAVLIGPQCQGTTEAFVAMMAQCPQVTTMGIRTAGANGDPTWMRLPFGVDVALPRRLELRADGQPLTGRGIEPDVPLDAEPEKYLRRSDALLTAAVKRLSGPATASTPARPGPSTDGQPAGSGATVQPQPTGGPPLGPPRVVQVSPGHGDVDVDPALEIRIRFDQPMNPSLTFVQWIEGFFIPTGPWRYLPKSYEFVIPVLLKPREDQRIVINPRLTDVAIQGFRSKGGLLAQRYEWSFATRRDFDDTLPPRPEVVSIEPPPGSPVGRVVPILITFDQPMEPFHFHGIFAEDGGQRFGQPYFHLRYLEDQNQFVIPVALPPNWSGTLGFQGFRSQALTHADLINVSYTTGEAPFGVDHLEQLATAGQSSELYRLLRQIRDARAAISSLEETIHITRYTRGDAGIFTTMESAEAVFRMEDDDKFYGDVSTMMNSPFIVGSDGETTWCYSQPETQLQVASCPLEQVYYRKVIICDPFHTTSASARTAIQHMKLEYLGTDTIGGRPCRVVQGWYAQDEVDKFAPHIARWWIDSRTFLPVQVVQEWASASRVVQQFKIRKINAKMAAADFRPPTGKDIRRVPAKPLDEQYNARYLNVIDASVGRMSVRWGRSGPAGDAGQGIQ